MDPMKIVDMMNDVSMRDRRQYHLTLGELIDALKNAHPIYNIMPEITGIGAYRGYYSDMALMTKTVGTEPMFTQDVYKPNVGSDEFAKSKFGIEKLSNNPARLAVQLEGMLGYYTDGYKGGCNEITRNTPLWLATDYGDNSDVAIIDITEDLRLITKKLN